METTIKDYSPIIIVSVLAGITFLAPDNITPFISILTVLTGFFGAGYMFGRWSERTEQK